MVSFPKYDSYKDSGVEWLGNIPSHWNVRRIKSLAQVKRGASPRPIADPRYFDDNGEYGWVRIEDVTKSHKYLVKTKQYLSKLGTSLSVKQQEGDIFISIAGSVGKPIITKIKCCIHDGFVWFKWLNRINVDFLFYVFTTNEPFIGLGKEGTQLNLNTETIGYIKIPFLPIEEQQKIAKFLDEKTAEIDEAISYKQRLIELLQEQKAILINQAVTKGINPNVSMRDSGIEWLGDIPEHWEVTRLKYVLKEVDERSQTGEEELLSVSHLTGVTPRSEKNVTMFMAEDYTGSKTCQKDDLVINIMWAWMGALGVSDRIGIVSSSYGVFRQYDSNTFNSWYLENLLRSTKYIEQYNRFSTGLRSSRLRLYSDVFLTLPIKIPPKQEQEKIRQVVSKKSKDTDTVINQIQKQINQLNELKQILISNVVTGKIKVL